MIDFDSFRKRWDALFAMLPVEREDALNAMSDAEINHFATIKIGVLTREEVIQEHLEFIAYDMGEVEDDEEMDF